VNVDCVSEGVIPIWLRKLGIDEHGSDLVEKSPAHAFGHSVVLRSVRRRHLVLDAFVLKILLGFAGDILAHSIGAEGPDALPGFHFGTGDELLKVVRDFRFCLEAIDEDLSRFVIHPGDEVLVAFISWL
jgi:hypothetical protein